MLASSTAKNDLLIVSDHNYITEYWWETYGEKSIYLVSLDDGSRKLLDSENSTTSYSFSPGGKYLIFFDTQKEKYMSYDLLLSKTIDISKNVSLAITRTDLTNGLAGHRAIPH